MLDRFDFLVQNLEVQYKFEECRKYDFLRGGGGYGNFRGYFQIGKL